MRATVRHCKDHGGTIHGQTRPEETPPAKSGSDDESRTRVCTIQHTGDMVAGNLDRRTSDVQGAAQPMHEESQGSRS